MIDNLEDYLSKATQKGFSITKFLDEASCGSVKDNYLGNITVERFGGYNDSERKRIIFHSEDITITNDSFRITTLVSEYNNKFYTITHRHVLGTLMSLGIERDVIGDIIVKDNKITIFCITDMAEFIITNLTSIAKAQVKFEISNEVIDTPTEEIIQIINVASLRLDAIVSKVLNLSREKSSDFIENGLVLINHTECFNSSKQLKPTDLLSIRKFGRVKIYEIVGISKKNRMNIKVGIIH